MKKFPYIFALACMVSQVAFGQTGLMPTQGTGTVADPYQVSSLANLVWMQQDSSSWRKHFLQTADINAIETQTWYGGLGWKPIGIYPDNYSYKGLSGTYRGNGYSIFNLTMNQPDSSMLGLFRVVTQGSVSNLTLSVTINGKNIVGGLVGFSKKGKYSNCRVSGQVTGTSEVGGMIGYSIGDSIRTGQYNGTVTGTAYRVGGLVGLTSQKTVIEKSETFGTLWATGNDAGGMVGDLADTSEIHEGHAWMSVNGSGTNVGGLVGRLDYSQIYRSFAVGTVASSTSSVGGLVGSTYPEAGRAGVLGPLIDKSFYIGTIQASWAGGLVGYASDVDIFQSYAKAEITGQYGAGFVKQTSYANIENCYAQSNGPADMVQFNGSYNYYSNIKNSYASGSGSKNLSGFSDPTAGTSGAVTGSYYLRDTSTTPYGGGSKKSTAEMKMQQTYAGWSFDSVWVIDEGTGFPFFQWERARWQYLVRYLDADSLEIDRDTVYYAQNAVAPTAPVRLGYHFIGWSTSTDSVIADLNVYAIYEVAAGLRQSSGSLQSLSLLDVLPGAILLSLSQAGALSEGSIQFRLTNAQGATLWSRSLPVSPSASSIWLSTPLQPHGVYHLQATTGKHSRMFTVKW